MAEYLGMTPTVVIGLGGTGKEVMIKVRRQIVEAYGNLDEFPIVSFMHIDTEQNAKVSEPQVVLKQDISLRPVEQVWAKVEDAKGILNKLDNFPYLAEWFPAELQGTDSILAGAGQIRALGKLAYTLNFPKIKAAFDNARSRITGHEKFMLDRWQVQLDQGINIFVVCSLSGGTGSGTFLDLAYCLRDWVPPSELPQTSACLVLPGAFSGLGDRVIANAYAALKELNYYSRSDTRFEAQYTPSMADRISDTAGRDVPFNFTYLVSNSNDKVTFANMGDLLEMIATNLFLDFSSGFSQYKKLVRDNVRKHWSSPDPLGYPQNFISFGLSAIQFPRERMLNACAYRLGKETVTYWSNPAPAVGAMRDLIKTEILPRLNLTETSDLHQIIDSISLGDNSKPFTKEVSDWVSGLRKKRTDLNIPFENLPRFVSVEQEKFEPHFNDSDTDPRRWSDYFQKMWDNLERLKVQKSQELRELISSMIEDRYRGPKFVGHFLDTLTEVFNEFRSDFDQKRQKDWIPRERNAANAMPTLTQQLDNHAKQFMLLNRKKTIDDDFAAIMNAMEMLYCAKIEVKARQLGGLLIDTLLEEVAKLRQEINEFNRRLDELLRYFGDKEQTYIRETGTLSLNGILLYDAQDSVRIYQQTIGDKQDSVLQRVSQAVLSNRQERLLDVHLYDPLRIKDLQERIVSACLDEFVKSPYLDVSAAQKFLQTFPALESQEAQIRGTFSKSEPFVRFSQEQARLGWEDRQEKRQKLVGIPGGTKPTDQAVGALLPIIRKTSTLTDKDIRPLTTPHQIFFVHEIGAFPLRLIEGMEKMRTVYRVVSQSDKNPLHTHTDQLMFSDLMPASDLERQVEADLILGQIFGLLTVQTNQLSGFTEIRFSYRDGQTGLEKSETLGNTWDEAEQYVLSDRNRRLRDTLHNQIEAVFAAASTKAEKLALYQTLVNYLEQLGQTLVGGRDNPEFSAAQQVVEGYLRSYTLTPTQAGAPATAQPAQPAVSSVAPPTPTAVPAQALSRDNGNLAKFEKLVATCFKKGAPSETEAQLLETFRQRYGISSAEAEALIAQYAQPNSQDGVYEYGLMCRAFLENDNDIDLEERAQLLDLQEELRLTDEQVEIIEANMREELGL